MDSDGDGITDWIEIIYGTDPDSALDTPVPTTDLIEVSVDMTNGWIEITLTPDLIDLGYRIGVVTEYTPTLAPPAWEEIPGTRTEIIGAGPWYVTPGGFAPGSYRAGAFPIAP